MSDHSHSAGSHGHDHGAGDHEAHGSLGLYLTVFVALCVLTAVSFGAFLALKETPKVAWVVMMAVSCIKALLVILFFMHLKWEANWKYILTFPAMFMSIFLVLMLVPDVGMRLHHASEQRLLYMAYPPVEMKALHEYEKEHGGSHGTAHAAPAGHEAPAAHETPAPAERPAEPDAEPAEAESEPDAE